MPLPAYPGMTNYQPMSPSDYAQFGGQGGQFGGQNPRDIISFLTDSAIRRQSPQLSEQSRQFDLSNQFQNRQFDFNSQRQREQDARENALKMNEQALQRQQAQETIANSMMARGQAIQDGWAQHRQSVLDSIKNPFAFSGDFGGFSPAARWDFHEGRGITPAVAAALSVKRY